MAVTSLRTRRETASALRLLQRGAPFVLALVALLALDRLAHHLAEGSALAELRAEAQSAAQLRIAVLASEIEKQRALPLVLSEDPDVRAALLTGQDARFRALDQRFEALSAGTRAAVIYLIDRTGLTVAASNWREETSFVGNNYGFRPYFQLALRERQAEHFALGTVSARPGLYLARRVEGPQGPLGVLVVKAEFDAIETEWARLSEPTFVTDDRTVVLVSSNPDWRFRALRQIALDERAAIRASLQFGDALLEPLPLHDDRRGADLVRTRPPGAAERRFLASSAPVPTTPWTLHVLAPTEAAVGLATTAARSLVLLVGVGAIGGAGFLLARRRRLARERAGAAQARRELEERVRQRTAELETTNERLRAEMDERRRAQVARQALQDELVQASRLAVLGQIVASVAHEINQPVAAIRTFADNAETLLDRQDVATAKSNLGTIGSLTERIGHITQELRSFARKAPGELGPVSLRTVVDGALLLLGHQLRQHAIELELALPQEDLIVTAERIRLEQVLVNLLQNAVEAQAGQDDGRIRIEAKADGAKVRVAIADNGPGLAPDIVGHLFLPFTTTKPTGLGLGLVISQEIVRELGGTLAAENGARGAVFTLTLRKAA